MSNFLVVFVLAVSCDFAFGFATSSESLLAAPIKSYRSRKGAVEYLQAEINKEHLDTGTIVSNEVRLYIKGMGSWCDDAGHLVARRLGGTGRETYNFIPQNLHFNRGIWKTTVEAPIYDEVKNNGGPVKFELWPRYEKPDDLRPFEIKYRATRGDGSVVVEGTIPNPKCENPPTTPLPNYAPVTVGKVIPAPVPVTTRRPLVWNPSPRVLNNPCFCSTILDFLPIRGTPLLMPRF